MRGTLTRLTFSEGADSWPVWSSDGQQVFFGSSRAGGNDLFSKPADGSGEAAQWTAGPARFPTSLSADGNFLIFNQIGETGHEIGMLRLDEGETEMILETPFNEHSAMLLPDDLWLAYVSDESGRNEVNVRPFPALDRKWQVSTEGGTEPMWATPNGNELFYRSGDRMMAVDIRTDSDFTAGKPTLLFEGRYLSVHYTEPAFANYDVAPDGQRFLMLRAAEEAGPTRINVVLNWFEELKRRVPVND